MMVRSQLAPAGVRSRLGATHPAEDDVCLAVHGPMDMSWDGGPGLVDRRQRSCPASVERRSPHVAGHRIVVGDHPARRGWMQAVCECGEASGSRIEGFAEAWVRLHLADVVLRPGDTTNGEPISDDGRFVTSITTWVEVFQGSTPARGARRPGHHWTAPAADVSPA